MQSDNGQASLWEQSDLLQLMAATGDAEASAPSSEPPCVAAEPGCSDRTSGDDAHAAPEPRDAQPEAATSPVAPALHTAPPGPLEPETATVSMANPLSPANPLSTANPLSLASSALPGASHQSPQASAEGSSLPACPQRLLILDTETTGLSPEQGQCIEVGAVLFDVASRAVLMQVSFLLPCEHNPAQHVNGIPAAVSRLSQPWQHGLACFEAMVASADAVLAHNVSFDRQWFGLGELPLLERPWICSMEDIRWPAERHLRANPSVRDLALAYGVPVWAAHRALTDCIYLVQVFQRCENLETLLRQALEPRRLVRARLSYDERQLAKDAGFRWNEPVPKAWSRRLSAREIAALPFAVDPVETEEPGTPGRGRGGAQQLWRRSA